MSKFKKYLKLLTPLFVGVISTPVLTFTITSCDEINDKNIDISSFWKTRELGVLPSVTDVWIFNRLKELNLGTPDDMTASCIGVYLYNTTADVSGYANKGYKGKIQVSFQRP
ncbi:MAG: hypothetical protein Ta2E_03140 [Mycoplasmoidaceae bacterium]|nr:MAG: hypothetical protein Ta2E_03140 [Mycoplasmoidaceae bacterium]